MKQRMDENAGERPELLCPQLEGAGVLKSNLWIPGPMGSLSSSSLDETSLKVVENDSAGAGV